MGWECGRSRPPVTPGPRTVDGPERPGPREEPAIRTERHVLWISTSRCTRGGIASYVEEMAGTDLWSAWRVRHLTTHVDGSRAGKAVVFATGVLRLGRHLAVDRPALAHVHTASNASFLRKSTVAAFLRAARIPVVVHVHGGGFAAFHAAAPPPLQWWIRHTLERSDAVIALSGGWGRRLEAIAPGAQVVVVPNPVAPASATSPPDGPVRVLCAGRMNREKGTWDLLDAWDRLGPGRARLVLVGDGDVDEVRSRAAATVEVLGWQPRERVHELMASSHVLVLASHIEGQPLVVLEAMARGLAAVATSIGGVPDLVDDGCTGLLVPPADPAALAAALARVLDDPDLRSRLGAAAREAVREHDPDAVAARLDALYREVLTRRGARARRA